MKKNLVIISAIVLAGTFGACKNVPQAEIDAATVAIDSLKLVQADVYLAEEFLALNDSLNAVNVEIETQKAKLIGNFGKSKEKLGVITTQAHELVAKTEARKQEIINEIEATKGTIQTIMDENLQLIASAPKGKEGKQAIEAITSDLNTINTSVGEVPDLVENGDLKAAQTKIMAAWQKASEINTELKTVMAKYNK